MKRIALCCGVLAVMAGVLFLSRSENVTATATTAPDANGITVKVGEKNPWTNLNLNNDPDEFHFAVVSDRTGGHRANVFSKAVHQVNLLQPTFVMSVGDLIEGYAPDPSKAVAQWDEFDGFAKNFQMPFFYVGGNHDLTTGKQADIWDARYGRRVYHFVYKNTLFLALNSEDGGPSKMGPEQHAYVKKALEENPNVRWTFVFLHKPLWTGKDLKLSGFAEIENMLQGRKYTMFCGHVHRYQKFVRNGMNYYQLATTGGGSRLRGVQFGEFDHVAWVTMKKDAPLIANVMLDGILQEDLKLPETNEPGKAVVKKPTFPVLGLVTLDGKPVSGAIVKFTETGPNVGKTPVTAEGMSDEAGRFQLSTYSKFDGCPAGEFVVTVSKKTGGPGTPEPEEPPMNLLPAKYGSPKSPLKVTVKDSANDVKLELESK